MHFHAPWTPDPTRVLTRRELALVLTDARRKARRSANGRRNLAILRLACCCGLRVSEIAELQLDDLVLDGSRPHLRLRSATSKGKRGRVVPFWWDATTLVDLRAWVAKHFPGDEVVRQYARAWRSLAGGAENLPNQRAGKQREVDRSERIVLDLLGVATGDRGLRCRVVGVEAEARLLAHVVFEDRRTDVN
jgi:integrase